MTHQQALDGLASERYLLDEMTEGERFEFEAHYFDCVDCAEDVCEPGWENHWRGAGTSHHLRFVVDQLAGIR